VQFYNSPPCSARAYVNNPDQNDFSFDDWVTWTLANSQNPDVQIYIGLPASPAGSPSYEDHYLSASEVKTVVDHFGCKYPTKFGGIMLWQTTLADLNNNYAQQMKDVLNSETCLQPIESTTATTTTTTQYTTTSTTTSTTTTTTTSQTTTVSHQKFQASLSSFYQTQDKF